MQEKISAIIPPKSTDNNSTTLPSKERNSSQPTIESNITSNNNVILESNLTSEQNISSLHTNQPLSSITLPTNTLDTLALAIQENIDMDSSGNSNVVTTALEVGENWEVITKEDEILETAKEFLGVKYVWAANGPSAFDCSGFTKYVYEKHGIKLPRYSGHQAKIGTKVAFNELEKGDLVFFDTDKKGKVNHVGIFLGDAKFIHASSGGKKVMITSFKEKKFYRNRFLHGQRIINSGRSLASL
jgi:cell wall-associated NlpC family hydrolase